MFNLRYVACDNLNSLLYNDLLAYPFLKYWTKLIYKGQMNRIEN